MTNEEHRIAGGQAGEQPVTLPIGPPKHMPYVKPMLYVKQTAKDCGNYLLHDLPAARREARKYVDEVLSNMQEENLVYPE